MGAAASIHQLYVEAHKWFKDYFDREMYLKDYKELDKNQDGGVSYQELQAWIKGKVEKEGGSWNLFITHVDVLRFAHVQAARMEIQRASRHKQQQQHRKPKHHILHTQRVIGLVDFKHFLIQIFAISILWVHFKNADDFDRNSFDFGNLSLNLDEFRLAMKTLTGAYAGEQLTEEQIAADFKKLDIDESGTIGFVEICVYCCPFIDPNYATEDVESAKLTIEENTTDNPDGSGGYTVEDELNSLEIALKECLQALAHGSAYDSTQPGNSNFDTDMLTTQVREMNEKMTNMTAPKDQHEKHLNGLDVLFSSDTAQAAGGGEVIVGGVPVTQVDVEEEFLDGLEEDLSGMKKVNKLRTINSRNLLAVDSLQAEIDKNKSVAKFVEVKCATEATINEILSPAGAGAGPAGAAGSADE